MEIMEIMDLLTMEKCNPVALHILSEGITCDLFEGSEDESRCAYFILFTITVHLEMFRRAGTRVPELQVRRDALLDLCIALQKSTNYTYASKFVLVIEDFSSSIASEKDAVRTTSSFLLSSLSFLSLQRLRVDVESKSKKLQERARRVPESSDSVVSELKKIVME